MNLAKLRGKISKEGYLHKAPQSKGTDKFRKGWKERYFVLKPRTLFYYEKKGEIKHKGKVDLKDALIEHADEATGEEFTFKICQSRQHFLYCKASSQAEYNEWIQMLVRAGCSIKNKDGSIMTSNDSANPDAAPGGHTHGSDNAEVPEYQLENRMCFGVMYKESEQDLYHERLVILVEPSTSLFHIIREGTIFKSLKIKNMDNITHATKAEDRLPTGKRLVPIRFEILRGQKSVKPYLYFLGTGQDAKAVSDLLFNVINDELTNIYTKLTYPIIHAGHIEIRMGDTSSRWIHSWAVLDTGRLMLFNKQDLRYPYWVISLHEASFTKADKFVIDLEAPVMDYALRCRKAKQTSEWYKNLKIAQLTHEERIQSQFGMVEDEESETRVVREENEMSTSQRPGGPSKGVTGPTFVASWGSGSHGQLGHRNTDDSILPNPIESLKSKSIVHVAASKWKPFAMGLTSDGTVLCWGRGKSGELGLGESQLQSTSPYVIASLRTSKIRKISCGRSHVAVLSAEGVMMTWGDGALGQLGHGIRDNYYYPKSIDDFQSDIVRDIACGGDNTGAIVGESHAVYLWGDNASGQLGIGNNQSHDSPVVNPFIGQKGANPVGLAIGNAFTAVVLENGQLYTWGSGSFGKLGLNDTEDYYEPQHVAYFDAKNLRVTSVDCGDQHMMAVTHNRMAYSWGSFKCNCLEKTRDRIIPARVKALGRREIVSVCAGSKTSFLVSKDGHVFACGSNENGELGLGRPGYENEFVRSILDENYPVVQVAAGKNFTVALLSGAAQGSKVTDTHLLKNEFNQRNREEPDEKQEFDEIAKLGIGDSVVQPATPAEVAVEASTEKTETVQEVSAATAETTAAEPKKQAAQSAEQYGVGWRVAVDPTSQKTYYYNKNTKERLWESDMFAKYGQKDNGADTMNATMVSLQAPLSPNTGEWKMAVDPKSGRSYYYNKATKQRRWADEDVIKEVEDEVLAVDNTELPSGWKEATDPKSGKTYFYNKELGERSWTRPETS